MSAAAAIRRRQVAAEREMTLELTPYEPTAPTVVSGKKVPAWTEHDPIRGKVQAPSSQGSDAATDTVKIGDVARAVLRAGLHIPVSEPVPVAGRQRGIGWEYAVSAIGQYDDPALLNRRFLVVEVPSKSKATARRLDVVEVEVPE